MESAGLKLGLRIWVGVVLVLLFAPIILIAWHDPDVRAAFLLSIRVGLVAMGIARCQVSSPASR